MNYRVLLGMVAGIVVVVTGAYVVIAPMLGGQQSQNAELAYDARERGSTASPDDGEERAVEEEDSETLRVEEVESEVEVEVEDDRDDAPTEMATPSTAPTPAPIPVPAPQPTPAASGYTLAQVAAHGTKESCWSIIAGTVYDLTPFVSKHPGGANKILKICGKDGTALFSRQHGGDAKPERILTEYRIGAFNG